MAAKRGLGRGLNALIRDDSIQARPESEVGATPTATMPKTPVTVFVDQIRSNPFQPRRHIKPENLAEMAQSILAHGIIEPLVVRKVGAEFHLIAGERRWRAARQAGLREVPVVVREVKDDREALELALIENLQREDLNPIEEGEGYRQLQQQFAMSQEEIARRVGKARATVANALRILALPADLKQMVMDGQLSAGHAKALLGVSIDEEKRMLAMRAVAENWPVRLMEKAVARLGRPPRKPRAARFEIPPAHQQYLTDKLHQHFGTSIRVTSPRTLSNGKKVKGVIEIDFFSNEDLTRIMELLGLAESI